MEQQGRQGDVDDDDEEDDEDADDGIEVRAVKHGLRDWMATIPKKARESSYYYLRLCASCVQGIPYILRLCSAASSQDQDLISLLWRL